MKKLLLLIILMASISSRADMGDLYFIKIEVEFKDGRKEIRSFFGSTYYINKDSLSNQNYLFRKVPQWTGFRDTINLYRDWVSFDCNNTWQPDSSRLNVISLFHSEKFAIKHIHSFKLLEVQKRPVGPGIHNALTESDQKWMSKKPIKILKTFAELCEFDIYIFEETEDTRQFINKLKEANVLNKSLGEEQEIYDLLHTIGDKKIVVVQFCSC